MGPPRFDASAGSGTRDFNPGYEPQTMSFSNYADEVGPTTLILVGLVLVIIPEPATTTLGVGLTLFGLAWWFFEWGRP